MHQGGGYNEKLMRARKQAQLKPINQLLVDQTTTVLKETNDKFLFNRLGELLR